HQRIVAESETEAHAPTAGRHHPTRTATHGSAARTRVRATARTGHRLPGEAGRTGTVVKTARPPGSRARPRRSGQRLPQAGHPWAVTVRSWTPRMAEPHCGQWIGRVPVEPRRISLR